jgi:hypothetical protein
VVELGVELETTELSAGAVSTFSLRVGFNDLELILLPDDSARTFTDSAYAIFITSIASLMRDNGRFSTMIDRKTVTESSFA